MKTRKRPDHQLELPSKLSTAIRPLNESVVSSEIVETPTSILPVSFFARNVFFESLVIHEPSDSSLLWDCVRVMVRLLQQADSLGSTIPWHDHCRDVSDLNQNWTYSRRSVSRNPTVCKPRLKVKDKWIALHFI
ncbi:hypothetical protein GOL22_27105 [Sinorhizobium medicae]|nr:hypothetical protein [Sinorhizobium medicae]